MPYSDDTPHEFFDLTVVAGDDLAASLQAVSHLSPVHEALMTWDKARKLEPTEEAHTELTKAGNGLAHLIEIDGIKESISPEQLEEIENQVEAWRCIIVDPEEIENM